MSETTSQELPPIDFTTFVVSIGSSVMMYLDRSSAAGDADHTLARQNIDILVMLEEKTRGNLTEDERKLLSGILYQARMAFVEGGAR